jgi:hypothetical protein
MTSGSVFSFTNASGNPWITASANSLHKERGSERSALSVAKFSAVLY